MEILTIVIILALVAAVASMLLGLVSLSRGGEYDKEHSTQFMWMRVGFQAAAVALLVLALLLH